MFPSLSSSNTLPSSIFLKNVFILIFIKHASILIFFKQASIFIFLKHVSFLPASNSNMFPTLLLVIHLSFVLSISTSTLCYLILDKKKCELIYLIEINHFSSFSRQKMIYGIDKNQINETPQCCHTVPLEKFPKDNK